MYERMYSSQERVRNSDQINEFTLKGCNLEKGGKDVKQNNATLLRKYYIIQ